MKKKSATEKDLHIYLDNEGAFEEEKACHIVYQVLKALEYLHSKNILHLDIKVRINAKYLYFDDTLVYNFFKKARKCSPHESSIVRIT